MAIAYNSENALRIVAKELELILGNKVRQFHTSIDNYDAGETTSFTFQRKEAFGYTLRIEITERFDFGVEKVKRIIREVLVKAIENLPRADRIERERLWGIK